MNENDQPGDRTVAAVQGVGSGRRALLKKLGRFTVYTAPATMILLQSRVAAASR